MGSSSQFLLHSSTISSVALRNPKHHTSLFRHRHAIDNAAFRPASVTGLRPRFPTFSNKPRRAQLQWRCCDPGGATETFDPPAAPSPSPSPSPVPFSVVDPESAISLSSVDLNDIAYARPLERSESDRLAKVITFPQPSTEENTHCVETDGSSAESSEFIGDDDQKGIFQQIVDIVKFAGPALGIWLSGPLMSLIDTAVVGNSSSIELAALGPGTVFCDQLGYVFMFLSVATSNLIATSLAKKDEERAAGHLSRLLFVALTCGVSMFFLTLGLAESVLKGFVGSQNLGLLPAAFSYVKIRAFAWPAVLVGMVAQSACLGMKDSWNPLKVLAVASFTNLFGDILLCTFLGYGIAGAAWATMASQYVGGYLMLRSLQKKGYSLKLSVPSGKELLHMIEIAAPVLLTMFSKVSFYAFITFLSTSLGAITLGAHQVMIGIYSTCTVSGEPLCQTAQSFMPGLIQGANPNFKKARSLLKSLLIIGAMCGVFLGAFAICFPWVFPQVFTNDVAVIQQMRTVTVPFLFALVITPPLLSLEGTLLAGRDLKFLSLSMASCFLGGSALLIALKNLGFGLLGFWWTLALFQSCRFLASYTRLKSGNSVFKEPAGHMKLKLV